MSLHVAGSEWDGRSAFGKLMRRVFDSTRRTLELGNADYYLQVGSADRDSDFRQFGKLTLECDDEVLGRSEFEAMCSAMVVAQTTKALTLLLEVDPVDQGVSGHWWKWLAYALFSRRVRSCSSITHLTLDSVGRLSTQDAEIFTAMLSLDHPEEALFSIPLGLVEECDAILRNELQFSGNLMMQDEPLVTIGLLNACLRSNTYGHSVTTVKASGSTHLFQATVAAKSSEAI